MSDTIKSLAKEMGDAGYCNYAACEEILTRAWQASAREQAEQLAFERQRQDEGYKVPALQDALRKVIELYDHNVPRVFGDDIGTEIRALAGESFSREAGTQEKKCETS